MPTGVAVVCDTDDCFAVYLAVETGDDEDARSASEVSQLAVTPPRATGGWSASASGSR
jgi:hypothetical protein